jgi:hypothetical protein
MKIATPLIAALLAALSVAAVRQARRAWRDPDWEPNSLTQSPRSTGAVAVLFVSLAVFFAGASVISDVPGKVATDVGAGLAVVGFLGLTSGGIAMATTRRLGWPRFLVPPPRRPGYEQAVPPGTAGPTIAEIQAASEARALEAAVGAARSFGAVGREAADADDEFIVIAGPGTHLTGAGSDAGRLVLSTRRLLLSTRQPNLLGQDRSWPVAELRAVAAGPGDTGMTLRFADGREEAFTVAGHRDLWLGRVSRLLSLPRPVTSWYGDPADAGRPVAVPGGAAVLVLWRAEGERRDRLIGYRVLLDGRKAATIRRGRRVELPVTPGRHVINLRSFWVGSPFIPFEADADQVLRFCCEPGGFPGMTQADMQRDVTGYIRLRRL